MIRRRSISVFTGSLLVLFSLLLGIMPSIPVHALSGADFQAGRIIDDVIFTNKDALNPSQIQAFLNAKVPVCDRNRPSSNPTYQPPYTCLKEYQENTITLENNYGRFNSDGSPYQVPGGKSAAQIIWDAGQKYSINPEVLLVTLQKEQSLVTDDWPWSIQYWRAMGNQCPDGPGGAQCNPAYAGFFNQVDGGAWQLRHDFDGIGTPGFSSAYKQGWNNILYQDPNANPSCGTKSVFIQNQATAVLYKYTPYTPNDAALNNLYGTGDSCSAYGNRNFWRTFSDWFGATLTTDYAYTFVNSSYSTVSLEIGQRQTSNFITIRNNGAATWYADGSAPAGQGEVRLSTLNYKDTPFADVTDPAWLGTHNQIKMTPAIVAPGSNATFTFTLKGPPPPLLADQLITFLPVVNGVGFMPNINMQMLIKHTAPSYSFVSAAGLPSQLLPNEQSTGSIVIKNTGLSTWYADGSVPTGENAMRLALKGYQETGYADRTDPAWLGTRNQIMMTPASVPPGSNATFTFKLEGPYVQHAEKLHFVPVLNGVTFLNDISMFTFMSTPAPSNSYSYVTATNPPATMTAGSIANLSLSLKNTGNTVWRSGTSKAGAFTTRLIMSNPIYRNSQFYNSADPVWLTAGQISMTTPVVRPGETGQFLFTWKAPTTPKLYQEGFMPVIDGYSLMPDFGMRFDTTVLP